MISKLQMSLSLGNNHSIMLKEPHKLADKYLSRIVLLQEQLSKEEEKLTQLLQKHGTKILSECL